MLYFREGGENFPLSDVFGVSKHCGEIGVVSPRSQKSVWYSHYKLEWLSHWLPHKEDIMIERAVLDMGT